MTTTELGVRSGKSSIEGEVLPSVGLVVGLTNSEKHNCLKYIQTNLHWLVPLAGIAL
jgi:hypothetical protein